MSREIKFRAYNRKHKVMFGVGGLTNLDYSDDNEYKYAVLDNNSAGTKGGAPHQWLDIEIMQFTGLKDKNGKEIYEGDVLTTSGSKQFGTVQWSEYQGRWVVGNKSLNRANAINNTVIGNIYENPELLK